MHGTRGMFLTENLVLVLSKIRRRYFRYSPCDTCSSSVFPTRGVVPWDTVQVRTDVEISWFRLSVSYVKMRQCKIVRMQLLKYSARTFLISLNPFKNRLNVLDLQTRGT